MAFDTRTAKAVERAFTRVQVKAFNEEKRVIEGWATTPTPDRVGDIVEPTGAKIGKGVKLLWQHMHDKPVGEVSFGKPTSKGIPFTATFKRPKDDYPQPLKDRLEEAWVSVRDGLVEFVSIGFRTIAYEVIQTGYKFTEWEMLELSLVTIPANSEASITSVKSIDRRLRGASALEKRVVRLDPAGVSAIPHNANPQRKTEMKTISEQISAAEASRSAKAAQLSAIAEKAAKEGRAMNDDENEQFDEIDADIKAIDGTLERLRRVESINVGKAVEVKEVKSTEEASKARASYQRTTALGPNSNIPKGIAFARAVKCLANAQGNTELAAILAEKNYADDARIANFIRIKAAVPAAYTDDSGGWAETIAAANSIGTEFIEFLRPMTIVDRLSGFRRVPFNVKVSRQTTGQAGYWVGDAKPTPLTSGVFDQITMGKTKVGSISVMSKEQVRFSHISAESTIRDDLAAAVVAKLDSTFIGTAAASAGVSPAGLLNGVSAQSSAGDTADDVRTDLANLYRLFDAANIDLDGISFVTTGRLKKAITLMRSSLGIAEFPGSDGGTLDSQPFISSNHAGAGDLVAISTRDILLADDGEVSVDMSDQASLEMLDGSLQQDATAGTGASVVSLWQSGLVAIKVERFINWQKARSAAVQFVGDATYQGVATA